MQYEWDTLDFENDEKVREEFMESPEVIRDEMINEVRYLNAFFPGARIGGGGGGSCLRAWMIYLSKW